MTCSGVASLDGFLIKSRLIHKVLFAITIPIVFQMGFLYCMIEPVRELDDLEQKSRKSTEILFLRDQIFSAMNRQILSCGIFRATHDPAYKRDVFQSAVAVDSAFRRLGEIWKSDAVKHHILTATWYMHRQAAFMYKTLTIELPRKHLSDILAMPEMYSMFMGNLVSTQRANIVQMFLEVEDSQVENARRSQAIVAPINQQLFWGFVATIFVSLGSGLIFSQSITLRLRKVVSNIEKMESKEQDLSTVSGTDEIALLNQSILDTDRKLRAAEEFQIQTARLIAQDLRGPLNELSDSMLSLRAGGFLNLTANGEERVERTLSEISRLRILVQDLVSLDKICRAGWDLNVDEIDLAEIAKTAIDTVRDFASSVDVEIVHDLHETRVYGDPVRLQQIALNLLTNAIKFSPAHTKIEVETRLENTFGKLSVTDHGTGIPEEYQPLIFGRFEQISRSDSTEKGGSGLGLAISKKLVESQHGKMGFVSKLGKGSMFWMQLPLEREAVSTADQSTSLISTSPKDSHTSSISLETKFRPTLWKKGVLLVVLPIFVQLGAILALQSVIGKTRQNVEEFNNVSQITTYRSHLLNSSIRGFLFSMLFNVTQNRFLLGMAEKEQQQMKNKLFQLNQVPQSSDEWAKQKNSVSKMVDEYVDLQNSVAQAEQDADGEKWFGVKTHKETERVLDQMNVLLKRAIDKQNQMLEKSVAETLQLQNSIQHIIGFAILASFVVSISLGVFIIKDLTSRVQRVVKNSQRLAEKNELEPPLPLNDEVSFVDRSFYEAAAHLSQLERFKQEIVAITSHEFRTPLTSLLAKADLMEAGVFGELNETGRSIVQRSKRIIVDLISVITNLLDVEKIQSGKSIVVKSSADMSTILRDVVRNTAIRSEEKQISIDCHAEEFSCNVDSVRLTQALTACAIEFLSVADMPGSIEIDARENGGRAEIRFSARGLSASRDNPFASPTNARGMLAYNLLSLIVEQHGGQVQMQFDEGKSTLIQISI